MPPTGFIQSWSSTAAVCAVSDLAISGDAHHVANLHDHPEGGSGLNLAGFILAGRVPPE